ncbi:hypothetical protein ACFSTD_19170 [Novosphingobium colocasiae]
MAAVGGLRTLDAGAEAGTVALFDLPGPLLTFVVSGEVVLALADGTELRLGAGALFLADAAADRPPATRVGGHCRLVQIRVDADWPGPRARPVPAAGETSASAAGREPLLRRMTTAPDGLSYYHDFADLFGAPGGWSAVRPALGLKFIAMAADTFVDWHPEVTNNLVLVMSGGLELEVSGSGEVQVFRAGDVCLAEDRIGIGHIDRVESAVQVAVLVIADEHCWPR